MNLKKVLNKDKTGEKIKTFIRKSSFSYEDIANELDLSSARVIYDWMNGFKMPNIEHLIVLSSLLQVQIEDILVIENVF